MPDPVVKTVEVACTPSVAFDIFVNRIAKWWPLDRHAASVKYGEAALAVKIEPRVGGAMYETMYNGERDAWGKVLEFEPGKKLAVSWHPGDNKTHPTRVDVDFEPAADGRTKVTLTHSGWEAWAEQADAMRDNYNGGWVVVFETCFAGACVPA